MAMTLRERKKLQRDFFEAAGPNTAAFCAMVDTFPDACFYMKDLECRIMALNKRNCEVCNIKNELDVVGLRSDEVFTSNYAEQFMALDLEVQRTKKPVVNRIESRIADRSPGFMISSVFPVKNTNGEIIGTMRLYRTITSHGTMPEWHGRLKNTVAYIQEHYTEEIALEQLAQMAGSSVSHFVRIFTKTLEMSPNRFIINTRINAARKLLETTDKLISDIAHETGFYDQSHMTRAFKAFRKTTPGEYRRNHRSISSP